VLQRCYHQSCQLQLRPALCGLQLLLHLPRLLLLRPSWLGAASAAVLQEASNSSPSHPQRCCCLLLHRLLLRQLQRLGLAMAGCV
jgi:hypothetical protein